MKCPECKSAKLEVVDKRDHEAHIRRRRECLDCGYRYTSYEITEKRFKELAETYRKYLKLKQLLT